MKQLVLLISGRGSNMQSIVRACRAEAWPARIAAVISNRPDAEGLQFAQQFGIATDVVDHRGYASRDAFDAALGRALDAHQPDLIALAGFMRVLGAGFVARYGARLLNIHPSLLPAFTGLHTHRRALEAGVKIHGATVHRVIPDLDSGPILAQAAVPVHDGDTESVLAGRVLAAEHQLYPMVLRWIVQDKLRLEPSPAHWAEPWAREPQWLWWG